MLGIGRWNRSHPGSGASLGAIGALSAKNALSASNPGVQERHRRIVGQLNNRWANGWAAPPDPLQAMTYGNHRHSLNPVDHWFYWLGTRLGTEILSGIISADGAAFCCIRQKVGHSALVPKCQAGSNSRNQR